MSSYIPIPREELESQIGNLIHLSWARGAYHGCHWRLMSIEGELITLETPRTRKVKIARASDACYTRMNQPKEEKENQCH